MCESGMQCLDLSVMNIVVERTGQAPSSCAVLCATAEMLHQIEIHTWASVPAAVPALMLPLRSLLQRPPLLP